MIALSQPVARKVSLPVAESVAPTLPDHLSWSQVNTMRSCPQKYYFAYVAKPPKDFLASSLKFGSAVHSGLEHYFRARMEGLQADEDALMGAYQTSWQHEEEPGLPIRFNKNEDVSMLETTARGMFSAFMQSPLAKPQGQVIAIEESFRSVLANDLPEVVARVDLIYTEGGAIHLVDFKTSRSRWNPTKVAEAADQLRLYELLTGEISGDTPVELHFAVLTKAKTPAFDVLNVPPGDSNVAALQHITDGFRQVYQAMQSGNFYPVPHPMNCTSCAFKSRCPAWSASSPTQT